MLLIIIKLLEIGRGKESVQVLLTRRGSGEQGITQTLPVNG